MLNYPQYAKAQVEIAKEKAKVGVARAEADKVYYQNVPKTRIKSPDGMEVEIPAYGDPAQLVRAARDGDAGSNIGGLDAPKPSAFENGLANAIPLVSQGFFMMKTTQSGYDAVGKSGNTTINSASSGTGTNSVINLGSGSTTGSSSIPTVTTYPMVEAPQ